MKKRERDAVDAVVISSGHWLNLVNSVERDGSNQSNFNYNSNSFSLSLSLALFRLSNNNELPSEGYLSIRLLLNTLGFSPSLSLSHSMLLDL